MAKDSPKEKRSVYPVQRVRDEWIHTLGIFSTFALAEAEANRYISHHAFQGYPKKFDRYAPNGWRKQSPDDDWGSTSFYILKYQLDVGSIQLGGKNV